MATKSSNHPSHFLQKYAVRLPADLRVSYAPDWGYFICRGRDRVTEFSPTPDEAMLRYEQKGEDRPESR